LLPYCTSELRTVWDDNGPAAFDKAGRRGPLYMADTAATLEALTRYYAEITQLDDQVGAVLDILQRARRTNDTIVLHTSEQHASLPFQ
jgi:arylsulfatase A-like enzyme